jgi:hypothetical protein
VRVPSWALRTRAEMEKPYIELDTAFPGIVSLFMFDREVASRLTAMGADYHAKADHQAP